MNTYVPNMSSTKSDIFDRQVERMFVEVLGQSPSPCPSAEWIPNSIVREDEGGLHVQLALPGWEANELTLEVNHGILTVAGQRTSEASDVPDIVGNKFSLAFRLPESVYWDRAKVVYARGLLTISFRKRTQAKPHRILIEVR
jgi:HSP20 family protein